MESEGQIDELGAGFLQRLREVSKLKVLSQDGAVDGGQGIFPGGGEGEHGEVSLYERTGMAGAGVRVKITSWGFG